MEFGAIRRVDVAASPYAVDFDIGIPLLLQSGCRFKDQCMAMLVNEHRVAGNSGVASRTLAAVSPQNSRFISNPPPRRS